MGEAGRRAGCAGQRYSGLCCSRCRVHAGTDALSCLPACLQLFSEFSAPQKVALGLPFHVLLDTLTLFASSSGGGELRLSYPGPNAELVLE